MVTADDLWEVGTFCTIVITFVAEKDLGIYWKYKTCAETNDMDMVCNSVQHAVGR